MASDRALHPGPHACHLFQTSRLGTAGHSGCSLLPEQLQHSHRQSYARCRRRRAAVHAVWGLGRGAAPRQQQVHVAVPPQQAPPRRLHPPLPFSAMGVLALLQAVALVGAAVTGSLARRRRLELESVNGKLRRINAELRRQREEEDLLCVSDPDTAAPEAYRAALEAALGQPAAAHPLEGYGTDNLSLAQARRELSRCLREGKAAMLSEQGGSAEALALLAKAAGLAQELRDQRAERAVARTEAKILRQLGDLAGSLAALERGLALSGALGEGRRDADALGAIADVYADLGDLERAAQYYDKCIAAIQDEESAVATSSTWDC